MPLDATVSPAPPLSFCRALSRVAAEAGRRRRLLLRSWLVCLLLMAAPYALAAGLELKDGRPFCQAFDCSGLLPEAEGFRKAEGMALPVIEALKGGKVYAYLFLSTDLVDMPSYSGKPMVTLSAIDPKGTILKAKIVQHHEPILLVGIPESVLPQFLGQYIGHNVADEFEISSGGALSQGVDRAKDVPEQHVQEEVEGEDEGGRVVPIDMITGATVTAQVMDQTLITSARLVAVALGIMKEESNRIVTWHAEYQPKTWDQLVAEGLIGHLQVAERELDPSAPEGQAAVDLYFADVSRPLVGINLLGESTYNWVAGSLQEGQSAFVIVSNGKDSFKGSGFVRGGIFERFYFQQGIHKYVFRDLNYEHLYGLKAEGVPSFRESGLFFLRDKTFDASAPWEFYYIGSHLTGQTATSKVFKTFEADFQFPEKYFEVQVIEQEKGPSMIEKIWSGKIYQVAALIAFLALTAFLFVRRDLITASAKRLELIHVVILTTSVVFIGLILKSPPSMTHLYPLLHSYDTGFRLDLYLSDPIQFVFWIAIALSLIWFGRGWFCGWICPYGALLELTHRLSRRILPAKLIYNFPQPVHDVLRRLRYVIFFALIGISIFSTEMAERLTEVEPFKTTWLVGIFNREWYLTLYWFALFGIGIFVYRFFCRYLCPLGAAFSLASFLQIDRIKRYDFCSRCKVCAVNCDSMSINDRGEINRYECYSCFECEQAYRDEQVCPPQVYLKKGKLDRISEADLRALQQQGKCSKKHQGSCAKGTNQQSS